jgi:hypothetical protein
LVDVLGLFTRGMPGDEPAEKSEDFPQKRAA